ncbi:MAG: protein kinase, partial [Candidatus Aminicenantes bacterium]|nr:protein kinase [Candidatus Aminicenantes bacterium]
MKKNILIVEYDNPTIDKIKDILAAPMFELAIAEAGDTAKMLLKKQKYDLVITAAMLPKFHGFDLAKFVSSTYPETKVIVMSSVYKGLEYKNQAISEFGADDFIEKPLDDNMFTELVYSLLNITKEDIQDQYDSGSTQIPTSDTKKIKIIKDNEEGQLSSDDIFGDIIDRVEKDPALSIDLGDESEKEKESATDNKQPGITQVLDKEYLLGKTNVEPGTTKLFKEREIDFSTLIKSDGIEKTTNSGRDIEDDISKKLEETLSGLGLESKSGKAPAKPPEQPVSRPEEHEKEEVIEEETSDEIEGYEILDMIARGGMAEIYKAKKKGVKGFEKAIVIKKILSGYGEDNKYIEMFVDEAKIAAELTHPNIVQIYDFGKKDNFYFIAMEYVEGKDLRLILNRIMERNSLLEEHLSIHLIIKTLEALGYAHTAKDRKGNNLDIVHRDISPPNILVSYSGEVKLTDFGVSKASNKSHQTLSGALKGKLLYMSPEQAKAEKNIDNRSDIYSVGVILFELLTGKKLFSGSSEMEVLNKVQEGKIIKPSEINSYIDPDLENIILRAVTLNKSKRYKNAGEMITALENYLYVNYNHVSTPVHLQNKMYDLFKDEILKSGIIINQKPDPYAIEKIITPQTVESIEESDKKITVKEEASKEVIELTEESEIKEPVELSDIPDEEHPDVTQFEDSEPEFPEPDEAIPAVTEIQSDETVIQPEIETDLEELIITDSRFDEKKKTRPLFKILLLSTLIIFSIYYFFIRENGLFAPSENTIPDGD